MFEPIAIVGRGTVLPDALDPLTYWQNILSGRLSLSPVPEDRWRLAHRWAVGGDASDPDRTWTDIGGYVRGFEAVFDPTGYALEPAALSGLDPLFQWVLYGARQALREAGYGIEVPRGGLVLGNLSFPSAGMAEYAEAVWLGRPDRPDPRNRFCSGLPAHLAANALGLGAGGYALDAACASSLYAIKLACDRLHDGTADVMVAGGVNGADDLFIHTGFCALSAMSRSGRSRPFHRDADGLVPAEGAAFVTLMRLSDALAADRRVLGVIRGVGLTNDGRHGGLLVPDEDSQERAMRLAYRAAGIAPETVSLVECHATGTPVGDAVEVRSMARVFARRRDLPVGSVKASIGHPITAAGVAGLLKVIGAMAAGIRPGMPGATEPIEALEGTPLRLLAGAEEWTGARRAAVSAFGFGGNNAHLIVDEWQGDRAAVDAVVPRRGDPEIAVVALAARVADGGTDDFRAALLEGVPARDARTAVEVDLDGLRFPPNDLRSALGQQLLVLDAAREAVTGLDLPRETTMVLIGMGTDAEVARYGARWRSAGWLESAAPDAPTLDRYREAFAPALSAAAVVGTMPNVVANRLNAQLDLAGPGFAVSAEEASGVVALEIGARALRAGEADAAVVGAVDLSHEPVHQAALRELGAEAVPGDAAVVLVLKRLADARRDGDRVLAVLDRTGTGAELTVGDEPGAVDPTALFGRAHAAAGLVSVAAAVLALHHRALPSPGRPAAPALGDGTAAVTVRPLGAGPISVRLRRADTAPWSPEPPARLYVYSGADRTEVLAALAAGCESDEGPARLAIVATDELVAVRREAARTWLAGGGVQPEGVAYRSAPVGGEIGFVFTNGSASYRGMGRQLMLAYPDLMAGLRERCGALDEVAGWAYAPVDGPPEHVLNQIWGASLLGQLHTEISRGLLGIEPSAVLGYSSGESTSLVAMGAWPDVRSLVADARASHLFTRSLVGPVDAVRRAWQRQGITGERWASFLVSAPLERVRRAVRTQPAVHLMAVNAPGLAVVGGETQACQRVLTLLREADAIPVEYDIAVHAPEVEEVRADWWALHHRPTVTLPGLRFYSCATGEWYVPDPGTAADAITAQAVGTIDFPRMVERAFADGVRVFIEHGPRGLCTSWIRRTLGDRDDYLAIALDPANGNDVRHLRRVVAELVAAGIPVAAGAVLAGRTPAARPAGPVLAVPAHLPPVQPPVPAPTPGSAEAEVMAAAPVLPPVQPAIQPAPGATPVPVATPVRVPQLVPAVTETHRRLVELHRGYLLTQSEVHQRFLRSRRAVEELLRARLSGVVTEAPVAPIPPVPPTPTPPTPPPPTPAALPGPAFSRADLEALASGPISALFGPRFAEQDRYHRQTRMPQPPLLLADRVTGIDAEPASMGTGTIWTETDVRLDGWYLDPTGRMPAGVLIESGQADLLLISWLGVDLLNRGERVYRLLGCDLTFHGSPPVPGETLVYDIHVDGHGEHAGQRLFFFHYDCRVDGELRLSVRNGQAGFFTDAELADSRGVLWDPAEEEPMAGVAVDPPALPVPARSFDAAAVQAFAAGRPVDCFGPAWESTRAHVRTPRIAEGRMLFLDEVNDFDPSGGPWGRGYLRAQRRISPDDWFFDGHFKNDPCMPGTLMFEGCLQAMSFHLAATGHTIDRDGWRFEPVPDRTYSMRCRGQVTPDSRLLTYEVFVHGLSAGPEPTLYADVLCTVDGVKAFHAKGIGLRLVPDWPLAHWRELAAPRVQETGEPVPLPALGGLRGHREPVPAASVDGFAYDYASLLACAWGRPTEAFGELYQRFDGTRRVARLPGPPYHFMSRVVRVDGPPGGMRVGSRIEAEYDVPPEVWYFEQNGQPTMPYAVLMEVMLQPCGWLASYAGSALTTDTDLLFRNLDGSGLKHAEIGPQTRVLTTRVELTNISVNGDVIIESFRVECLADGVPVHTLESVFGYFPAETFREQVGLPPSEEERARLAEPGVEVDLAGYPAGALRLPGPMLRMIDRITGYWPTAGAAGLGRLRAEKDVDPGEWFFKAHFFQDPVQPGSLGVEAMCQLLQYYLLERGAAAGMRRPRFESPMPGAQVSWKYRGQVTPANTRVTVEAEILAYGTDERGRYALAEAWLWVDGKRIYHARNLGVRVVDEAGDDGRVLDPAQDDWLLDHRPTWTVPALPMMSTVDLLAQAAGDETGQPVCGLRDVRLHRWVPVPGPVRWRTEVTGDGDEREATLLVWRDARNPALSRYEPVASATVCLGGAPGTPPPSAPPLPDAVPVPDPYAAGALFHGPAFQYLTSLRLGAGGSSATLDAGRGGVPPGLLHQGLLDAATHAIPHDAWWRWSPEIGPDVVGYPHRIDQLTVYEPLPHRGVVRVEARFAGFADGDRRHPVCEVQLLAGDRVLVALRLVEVLLPKGILGSAAPEQRRAFLRDRRYADGLGLSRTVDGTTRLSTVDVEACDWLPGTVAAVYGLSPGTRGRDHLAEIAVRDHVARRLGRHPSAVDPGTSRLTVRVEQDDDTVVVTDV
jgi:acyl transferase domain-containing protein/3-hydroxymyristoyl/3-hydroxydecanoyl-(acyl carrier protein) dehydratase